MGNSRQPGPMCQINRPLAIDDGTMCRAPSPQPGPHCETRPGGIGDYVRRARNVKDAFMLGVKEYAYAETLARLGADFQLIIDSLWPGFIQALQIYGWSIGSGAALFGAVGAYFSGGVAAAPAAALGAQVGADVATAILFFMGVKFLAEYVLAHLDRANEHFKRGFGLAWEACGTRPPLDLPAREFGRGFAELFSLLLEAAVVWVTKKGLKAGMDSLNRSKAGQALAPYARVQFWRKKLGVTDAPVPRRGIATTIEFFEDQARKGKLDAMEEAKLEGYWKAMDFSKGVTKETLSPGKELVGYRDPQSPFGFYYTERGTFLDRVGVDYATKRSLPEGVQGPEALVERKFVRYRVKQQVETLKSTASGARAWDTKQPVPGGGIQYFIPRAWEVLEIVEDIPEK